MTLGVRAEGNLALASFLSLSVYICKMGMQQRNNQCKSCRLALSTVNMQRTGRHNYHMHPVVMLGLGPQRSKSESCLSLDSRE